jgi:hypothetical protein
MKKSILLWSIILVIGLGLGSCRGCQRAVADYNGDVEEIWQVRGNGGKRIADYEWFEGKYRSIESEKANIRILAEEGENFSDQIFIVNRWIGEYNARSSEYTRAMWKSDNLPRQLDLLKSSDFR